jgi:hypothetical protein
MKITILREPDMGSVSLPVGTVVDMAPTLAAPLIAAGQAVATPAATSTVSVPNNGGSASESLLTGIDTATPGAVTDADTVTEAIGKLQATKVGSADALASMFNGSSAEDLEAVREALSAETAYTGSTLTGSANLTAANAQRQLLHSSASAGLYTAALDATTGCIGSEWWEILTDPDAGGVPSVTNGTETLVGGAGVALYVRRRGVDDYVLFSLAKHTDASGAATGPQFVSAAIANGSPAALVITFDDDVDGVAASATSAFSLTNSGAAQTVSSVAHSGSTCTLTLSRDTLNGETVKVGYVPPAANPLQNAEGDLAIGFGLKTVTNNVAGGGALLRFTGSGSEPPVESQPGGAGTPYKYATDGTSTTIGNCLGGSPTVSMPASNVSDVSWQVTWKPDTGTSALVPAAIGLHTSSAAVAQTSYTYGIQAVNALGGNYKVFVSGVSTTANGTATTSADGDRWRLIREGGTNVIKAQIARNATPTTWITLHTFAATTVAQLFPQFSLSDGGNGGIAASFEDVIHVGMT